MSEYANLTVITGRNHGLVGTENQAENRLLVRLARLDEEGAATWVPAEDFTVDGIRYDYRTARHHIAPMFTLKELHDDTLMEDDWDAPFNSDGNGPVWKSRSGSPWWADLEWAPDVSP